MTRKVRDFMRSLQENLETFRGLDESGLLKVAEQLMYSLDTPISLGVALRIKYGLLKEAVTMSVNPMWYLSARDFSLDYQAVSFLKKAPLTVEGLDPVLAGVESFFKAEEICRATNIRLRRNRERPVLDGIPINSILHRASVFCSRILGKLDAAAVLEGCRFGPGADSCTSGNRVVSYNKLLTCPEVTADASELALGAINSLHGLQVAFGRDPAFGPQIPFGTGDLKIANSNRITFVPKSAKTHRVIAIEPHLNIFLQLGVGALIRRRLKQGLFFVDRGMRIRLRLDLDKQQPINQAAARAGSIYNTLATVDMSMASDTVSREIVRELLPEPWFNLLDALRSKSGVLPAEAMPYIEGKVLSDVITYEKFSSMGNGFTFELETLLFWCLALACVETTRKPYDDLYEQVVYAYGDDVVLPRESCDLFYKVLDFCGFVVNVDKSYVDGPFRESCGKDYYLGTDCRPFFQKEIPNGAQAIYRLANGLRRAAARSCDSGGCSRRYLHAWDYCVRRLPPSLRRLIVPPRETGNPVIVWHDVGFGEVVSYGEKSPDAWDDSAGLIGNFDEFLAASPTCVWNSDLQRVEFRSFGVRGEPRRFWWPGERDAEKRFYSEPRSMAVVLYETRNGNIDSACSISFDEKRKKFFQSRRGESPPKVKRLTFEQCRWKDLGPWV